MAKNGEKPSAAMQLNETVSSSRKRKAAKLIPEAPPAREVDESMVEFLFEKRLTFSDVKGQNRIIIPRAHAEQFFGEYTCRDSTSYIFMDDMKAAKVWRFVLRDWQNGGGRMYVLEGTGAYTKEHDIKAGDFVILYKDYRMNRYAIGWRKSAENDNLSADVSEKTELAPAAATSCVEKVEEYRPEFGASEDEANHEFTQQQPITDNIDPEYVHQKFNMTWDQFLDFNPFD